MSRDVTIILRPLSRWPKERTPPESRLHNPFKGNVDERGEYGMRTRRRAVSYSDTRALLDKELRALGVREAVMQIGVREGGIRIDGELKANAQVTDPGVVLSFTTPKLGALTYACDTFREWQSNVRGIAKGLEALRLVERYGIGMNGEQYVGWKAIGTGTPMAGGETQWTADEAAEWVAKMATEAGLPCDADDVFAGFLDAAYKAVAKRVHPDVHGGSEEAFKKLRAARELIMKAGG